MTRTRQTLLLLAVTSATAVSGSVAARAATPTATDEAFIRVMVPHHQMAVDMVRISKSRAVHGPLRSLARRIAATQHRQIQRMRAVARRIGVKPYTMPDGEMSEGMMEDLETLGVSMGDSGMMMSMRELREAKVFDRKFLAMMIPHHRGGVRMARAELRDGAMPSMRRLARNIVVHQRMEIHQMRAWRKAWYGIR